MDEKKHWNNVAPSYDHEVLNVFESERNGILPKYFKRYANPEQFAVDFGCGVGNGFDLLSKSFKNILALDISQNCLDIAQARQISNIDFRQADLTDQNLNLPKGDFGLCANVLILPDVYKNELILKTIHTSLKRGAHVFFVVPSLDSLIFSAWRMIDLYKREGIPPHEIPDSELEGFKATKREILQGIVHIEGVPTKHYSRPELDVFFSDAGFAIETVDKLEYDWTSEFATPPDWMKAPYPWDWFIVCKKQTSSRS